ncbi:MAG TPA: M1 family aminopeptidase [Thermoanaerobaculia bacterium]|nr:M1 family aminopeptidase [Thermoanaerobaculia bacterium]
MPHPALRRLAAIFSLAAASVAAVPALLAQAPAAAPPASVPAEDGQSGAARFARLATAIDRPAVGAAVVLGGPLVVGRATITPAAGTAVRLLLAGSDPVGLWVDGPAALSYAVEDRFSVPVARRNVKRAAAFGGSEQDGRLMITDPLRGAVVWSWSLAAGAARDSAPVAGDTAFSPWAAEVLQQALFSPPSNLLLQERGAEGAGAGAAYALFDGEREDLRLVVDPRFDRHESLDVLGTVTRRSELYKGRRLAHDLADQPIGRPWWEAAPPALIASHLALEVVSDGSQHVRVTSRTTVRAVRGGEGVWRVDLESTVYDGRGLSPLVVEKVAVDGEPAGWVHQGDELLVDLGRRLAAGQTAEVEVVNAGALALRPNNDNYWSLTTWPWYPQPPLDAELASLDIRVLVPEPYTPFASGETTSRLTVGGVNMLRTRLERPVQFPVVAAGRYHVVEREHGGVKLNVASYAFGKEKAADRLARLFFGAADVLGQILGTPYPFAEVDVVEINDWGWGQAPAGVVFITQEAYNPISDELSRVYSGGVNGRYVHEVAHAWWGHVLKMPTYEEQWLTESFADYSAALALQAMAGGKKGDRELQRILRDWKSRSEQLGDGASIFLANYLAGEDEGDHRVRRDLLYSKGPLVLHALRQELGRQAGSSEKGDRIFQAVLRAMLTNFAFRHGETRHLVGILNQVTGTDWQPWFERYVYGTEIPKVDL